MRRQEAAVRFLYGFTGSAASTILFSGKLYKFENRRYVGGIAQSLHAQKRHGGATVTAPSPRSLCTEATRAPYEYCLEAAETARQLHWDCTICIQSPCSLCTRARLRNCTMLVDNENTYAVARSHLRCQKNAWKIVDKFIARCLRQMWTKHKLQNCNYKQTLFVMWKILHVCSQVRFLSQSWAQTKVSSSQAHNQQLMSWLINLFKVHPHNGSTPGINYKNIALHHA